MDIVVDIVTRPFVVLVFLIIGLGFLAVGVAIFSAWRKHGGLLFNGSQQNARGQIEQCIHKLPKDQRPWARKAWVRLWDEIQRDLTKLKTRDISSVHLAIYLERFETMRIIEGFAPKRNAPRRAVYSKGASSVVKVHNLARENRHTVYEDELEPIDFIAYRFDLLQQALAGRGALIELFYRQENKADVTALIEQLDLIDYKECRDLLRAAQQDFEDYLQICEKREFENEFEALDYHGQNFVDTKAWDKLLVEVDVLANVFYRLNEYYYDAYPWAS